MDNKYVYLKIFFFEAIFSNIITLSVLINNKNKSVIIINF